MVRLAVLFLALAIALPVAAGARAQGAGGAGNAVLSARAYEEIPAGAAVAVIPLDDSDRNLRLMEAIVTALQNRDIEVRDDAPLTLEFETEEAVGISVREEPPGMVDFQSNIGGRYGGDEQRVRVSVFSNTRDSLLTGRRSRDDDGAKAQTRRFHIDFLLLRTDDRRRLWQGKAVADLGRGDVLVTGRAMVPRLVDKLGQTAEKQFFTVP